MEGVYLPSNSRVLCGNMTQFNMSAALFNMIRPSLSDVRSRFWATQAQPEWPQLRAFSPHLCSLVKKVNVLEKAQCLWQQPTSHTEDIRWKVFRASSAAVSALTISNQKHQFCKGYLTLWNIHYTNIREEALGHIPETVCQVSLTLETELILCDTNVQPSHHLLDHSFPYD